MFRLELDQTTRCHSLVNPKGNQSWIFLRRTDAEAETSTFWPPDVKSQLIGRDPGAGKYWRREEKGATEDEMVGWHHRLNGHEFEQTPGDGEGQGGLACCSPWGRRESDTTEQLNNNQSNVRKQRGTKEPLIENERGKWKSWLKTQHSKN